jgi:ubiquinone/menaquinone biosynthesis C-methylase UbiE
MRVLDCGCGPGSLTISLAEVVPSGEVVGTDVEESQLDIGREEAIRRNFTNVRFERASIYELPFADDSFDAVFVSAVLGNLREPLQGVNEVRRVLKPGGVLGVKEFDHGGDLLHPRNPDLVEGLNLYDRLRRHNGHDPESGRKLLCLLQQAHFRDISVTATYETLSTPQELKRVCQGLALLVNEAFAEPLQNLGWADDETIQRITRAWQQFADLPGAFYALAWCEALAWK